MFVSTSLNRRFRSGRAWFPTHQGARDRGEGRARGCGREGGEVPYKLTLCTDGGIFVSTSLNSRFRSGLAWFPTHQSESVIEGEGRTQGAMDRGEGRARGSGVRQRGGCDGEVTYKLTVCTDCGMFVSTSLNSRFRSGLAWFSTRQGAMDRGEGRARGCGGEGHI